MAVMNPPGESGKETRKRLILEYFEAYIRRHGHPPSLRETAPAIGLSQGSFGVVQAYAKELVAEGKLRKTGSGARRLTLA